jgi:hypothetical protein
VYALTTLSSAWRLMRSDSSHRFRLMTVALSLGLFVGCGRFHSGEADGDLAARVFFTNESLDEAAVYAVSGTQQVRIGTVMGGRTDTLVVPSTVLNNGTIRLVARPLAHSSAAQSGPFPLHGGDEMSVRLPMNQMTLIVLPPPS